MSSLPTVAGMGDEPEEVSILEKVLKILITLLFLSILYSYVEPVISEITSNAQRDRVTGDFNTIADAINRFRLKEGKNYTDTALSGLVEKKYLKELPRDPWGSDYVYSFFFDQLLTPGPNKQLDTFVPGLRDEASEAENDDRQRAVTPISRLVYVVAGTGTSTIVRGEVDGFSTMTVLELPGDVQAVSVLPGSKSVVYSLKRGQSYDIQAFDWEKNERLDLTADAFQDTSPVWCSPKSDQVAFLSDREQAGGPPSLFAMQLPAKTVQKLVDKVGEGASPATALAERRVVYFVGLRNERPAILSITLPETAPVEIVAGRTGLSRPSPSPNGVYLAYLVQEASGTAIEVIELKSRKQLFRKEGASPKGWIAWSPDGDKIAYQVEDKGQARLVLAHPALGRSVVHPNFVMAFARFSWIK